jgi:hypothetical protein
MSGAHQLMSLLLGSLRLLMRQKKRRTTMANLKTLSAVLILSGAIATPALAHTKHHNRLSNYRGAYNQLVVPSISVPRSQIDEGQQFNRSFPGGSDPDLNPSGS